MQLTVRVFVKTTDLAGGVPEDDWAALADAIEAVEAGIGEGLAMVEVQVSGSTPGWCVEGAVWKVSQAISAIPGLRPNVHVSQVELL